MKRPLLLLLLATSAQAARPPEALQADRAAAAAELRDLDRRGQALEVQLENRRQRLQLRLRALYKLSSGGYLRLLTEAGSLAELQRRQVVIERVLVRDRGELRAIRQEMRDLKGEQARRQAALVHILVQADPAGTSEVTGLQRQRGHLVRPVRGPLVTRFGLTTDPLGLQVVHRGIELRSQRGEPVLALAAGRLCWIGPVPGIGPGVAIDHGEGYLTITAPIEQLRAAKGAVVARGAVLGVASDDKVYLELSQAGTPIDPAPWLASH